MSRKHFEEQQNERRYLLNVGGGWRWGYSRSRGLLPDQKCWLDAGVLHSVTRPSTSSSVGVVLRPPPPPPPHVPPPSSPPALNHLLVDRHTRLSSLHRFSLHIRKTSVEDVLSRCWGKRLSRRSRHRTQDAGRMTQELNSVNVSV